MASAGSRNVITSPHAEYMQSVSPLSFYSHWHQKQLVVMRLNTCLTPFTTIIIHNFTCMMIWEEFYSSWPAWLVFPPPSFTDCRYPVGIIGSINTTLRHCVHSSFKNSTGTSLGWSVWGMMKRRSEDCFYIYVIILPITPKWKVQRCSEKLKYFYPNTLTAQRRTSGLLWKMKPSTERMWIHVAHTWHAYNTL